MTGPVMIVNGHQVRSGALAAGDVFIEDGLVSASTNGSTPESATTIDASGLIVAPGFLDLQVNGGYGVDLAGEPHRISELARELPRHGITAWLPTLVSTELRALGRFVEAVSEEMVRSLASPVAVAIGAHLEGPAIEPEFRGAHVLSHLRDAEDFAHTLRREPLRRVVRLVTIAPELDGGLDLLAELVATDVVVSIGHTGASAEQTHAAIDAGARYVTHLFNVMTGFHHRSPGVAIAALVDERITAGLIVDGHHLHDDTVRLAWKMLGPERLSLVSDATAALGAAGLTAALGDEALIVGEAVRTGDGTLAGTDLALDQAVRNLMGITGCDLVDALATVTTVPADLLGDRTRGRLDVGCRADLVLLDPDGTVRMTMVGGDVAWTDGSVPWK